MHDDLNTIEKKRINQRRHLKHSRMTGEKYDIVTIRFLNIFYLVDSLKHRSAAINRNVQKSLSYGITFEINQLAP